MIETRATFEEPNDVQQATLRLKMTLQSFAGEKSDLRAILNRHSFRFEELLMILDASLSMQRDELARLKDDAKRLTERIENLAQQKLL